MARQVEPESNGADLRRLLYRIPETAEILGIGKSKTYELINDGRLSSVMIDGARRVSAAAIQDFIERLEGGCDRG